MHASVHTIVDNQTFGLSKLQTIEYRHTPCYIQLLITENNKQACGTTVHEKLGFITIINSCTKHVFQRIKLVTTIHNNP